MLRNAIFTTLLAALLLLCLDTRALAQQPAMEAPTAHASSDPARAARLRLEIEDLRRQESEISQGGPVIMMIFGYVFAPLVLIGPVMLLIGDVGCDFDGSDCTDLTTAGLVMTGLGIVGATVGLIGILQAQDNADQRRYLRGRIDDKNRELESLSFDLHLGPGTAQLQLRGWL